MFRIITVSTCSLLLLLGLAGCTSQAEPSLSTKQESRIAASNRAAAANDQAKAQDASAAKKTGQQYQAEDDHVTSATKAAAAVEQVLNAPKHQLFASVPTVNVDGQGHHYYQVNAFAKTANGQRGQLVNRYFVYLDGKITTKQLD
ncbi:hypothetical protein D1831_07235 [Lactiplantibacillus garii]|uniref:Lipoprotein n=1 Tax=Lactiplantibacillus garii TaxID=2306423 RepID=A0A426D775_9LACO|nr:hypothetical protein [Lactiplantibacillus garii]RRK10450.1 hypothetical protein D1831_07235 [Lactiplantibacillus garii]